MMKGGGAERVGMRQAPASGGVLKQKKVALLGATF